MDAERLAVVALVLSGAMVAQGVLLIRRASRAPRRPLGWGDHLMDDAERGRN